MKEKVNHPKHYTKEGRRECIEEMIDIFGVKEVQIFCKLNAYKYRYRHEMKNGQEDLDKAEWYMNKLLELEGVADEQKTEVSSAAVPG